MNCTQFLAHTKLMHTSFSSTLVKKTLILLPLLGLNSVYRLLTAYVTYENFFVFTLLFAIFGSIQVQINM